MQKPSKQKWTPSAVERSELMIYSENRMHDGKFPLQFLVGIFCFILLLEVLTMNNLSEDITISTSKYHWI